MTVTHRMSHTRTFRTWLSMKRRCYNPNVRKFANHGGRGIVVCDRWLSDFTAFLVDMGEQPDGMSLDRIDNDGPYSPDNCRWATASQQARNRRDTVFINIDGVTKPFVDWCEQYGIGYYTARTRIQRYGWDARRAITTPVTGKGRRPNEQAI